MKEFLQSEPGRDQISKVGGKGHASKSNEIKKISGKKLETHRSSVGEGQEDASFSGDPTPNGALKNDNSNNMGISNKSTEWPTQDRKPKREDNAGLLWQMSATVLFGQRYRRRPRVAGR